MVLLREPATLFQDVTPFIQKGVSEMLTVLILSFEIDQALAFLVL